MRDAASGVLILCVALLLLGARSSASASFATERRSGEGAGSEADAAELAQQQQQQQQQRLASPSAESFPAMDHRPTLATTAACRVAEAGAAGAACEEQGLWPGTEGINPAEGAGSRVAVVPLTCFGGVPPSVNVSRVLERFDDAGYQWSDSEALEAVHFQPPCCTLACAAESSSAQQLTNATGCESEWWSSWASNGYLQIKCAGLGSSLSRVLYYAPGQSVQAHAHDAPAAFKVTSGALLVQTWGALAEFAVRTDANSFALDVSSPMQQHWFQVGDIVEVPARVPHAAQAHPDWGATVHELVHELVGMFNSRVTVFPQR